MNVSETPAASSSPPEESITSEPPTGGDAHEAMSPSAPAPTSVPEADPFLGMGRDLGTFLGGMPLDLSGPPVAPPTLFAPPPLAVEPAVAPEVAADIVVAAGDSAALDRLDDDSEGSLGDYLSKMNAEEPRQELFEATPDSLDTLPDSMGPISDVVEVLGEESHCAATNVRCPTRRADGG